MADESILFTRRGRNEMVKIAITMGCPVGIGPEIIVKYYSRLKDTGEQWPIVIGDLGVIQQSASNLGIEIETASWQPGERTKAHTIPVLSASALKLDALSPGCPDRITGNAMASYIEKGIELALKKDIDAIATCPINKATLHLAGYNYPGHTEMLAHLTQANDYAMMMAGRTLKVVLATIHCRFEDIILQLKQNHLVKLLQLMSTSLKQDFGIPMPRIAVAGLNPHAGEGGAFGREEIDIIQPAISQARSLEIDVSGPYPPDTIFYRASQGAFDAVLCMYHDQGLIPFKLLHFHDGVNVTLGLPIVRTSVDHGTAYDIAGTGKADETSLSEAVYMAAEIVHNRNRYTI